VCWKKSGKKGDLKVRLQFFLLFVHKTDSFSTQLIDYKRKETIATLSVPEESRTDRHSACVFCLCLFFLLRSDTILLQLSPYPLT
jgi:hypothetical protein